MTPKQPSITYTQFIGLLLASWLLYGAYGFAQSRSTPTRLETTGANRFQIYSVRNGSTEGSVLLDGQTGTTWYMLEGNADGKPEVWEEMRTYRPPPATAPNTTPFIGDTK